MNILGLDLGTALVLVALGPVLAGLYLGYQWYRSLLGTVHDLQRRLDDIASKVGGVADETRSIRAHVGSVAETALTREDIDDVVMAGVATGVAETVKRSRAGIATDLLQTYRQLEALQILHSIVPVGKPLPASRVWAASPDLLLYLVDLVERRRPGLIVECGSGLSTLWFGLALRRFGIDGRVVSLEHLEPYAEQTRLLAERHGLGDVIDVRVGELEAFELDGSTFSWYSRKVWSDLAGIDLLFVDGPPAQTNALARYPALPLLLDQLGPSSAVVLDDLVRKDEQQTLERWLEEYPDFTADRVRLEKHAALLYREVATWR